MTRYRVRFLDEAADEIREATRWYRKIAPGLDAEFVRALDVCIAGIVRNPVAYAPALDTARRAILRKFPYAVYFVILGETIQILACYHLRRDPQTLRGRL